MINGLVSFLNESPSAFNTISSIKKVLYVNGYEQLFEDKEFKLAKNKKYFVTRNDSSIIAFNIGNLLGNPSLMITSSHSDCPCLKLKPNSTVSSNNYLKLNVEVYGGLIYNSWFDRPLSFAGRIICKKGQKIISKIINYKKPFCIIPSVAIHMNKEVNNGLKLNPQIDLMPLVSTDDKFDFIEFLKSVYQEDEILGFDLYLYPCDKALIWGKDNEFISSFHIDNLECTYCTLSGFLNTFNENNINMYCCFDNEEVGSATRQGAMSDFYKNTIKRITKALELDYYTLLANSFALSCDNAHAVHPNHPELTDQNNNSYMNKGIVIKFNANQSYTSDSLSYAIFTDILKAHNLPFQVFANRSDQRGGSTLGNIANSHVSLLSLDIGLAQLAMHSSYETTGSKDVEIMVKAIKEFYSCHLTLKDSSYSISR